MGAVSAGFDWDRHPAGPLSDWSRLVAAGMPVPGKHVEVGEGCCATENKAAGGCVGKFGIHEDNKRCASRPLMTREILTYRVMLPALLARAEHCGGLARPGRFVPSGLGRLCLGLVLFFSCSLVVLFSCSDVCFFRPRRLTAARTVGALTIIASMLATAPVVPCECCHGSSERRRRFFMSFVDPFLVFGPLFFGVIWWARSFRRFPASPPAMCSVALVAFRFCCSLDHACWRDVNA